VMLECCDSGVRVVLQCGHHTRGDGVERYMLPVVDALSEMKN
jgi:hypothetical protein